MCSVCNWKYHRPVTFGRGNIRSFARKKRRASTRPPMTVASRSEMKLLRSTAPSVLQTTDGIHWCLNNGIHRNPMCVSAMLVEARGVSAIHHGSYLRPLPLIRLPARGIPNAFHVHGRIRTDFPRPLDGSCLRPGHIACPLRPRLAHGKVAFKPAFHKYSFVAHRIEPSKAIVAIHLFAPKPGRLPATAKFH